MADCLFCKIIAGDIPGDIVYRDDRITAFRDINPKARVHLLVVPNHHIESLEEVTESSGNDWLLHLTVMLPQIARDNGLADGFRCIINTGKGGGQEVGHLHYHIMGDVRDAQWHGL